MKRLWAPWRVEYVTGEEEKEEGCLFCNAYKGSEDRKRLVVHRGDKVFAMLNKYPYIRGHLLIAPARHVSRLKSLKAGERVELFDMIRKLNNPTERLVLILYKIKDYPAIKVATALKTNEGNIYTICTRGIINLRKMFKRNLNKGLMVALDICTWRNLDGLISGP